MIILGIDPGLARVGFGLIETGPNPVGRQRFHSVAEIPKCQTVQPHYKEDGQR